MEDSNNNSPSKLSEVDEDEDQETPREEDENNSLYMSQIQYKELKNRSSQVGNVDTIRWLRSRHKKTTMKPYLMTSTENKHIQQIKTVFQNFDFDGSKTLDAEEVFQMLEQNNIDIPIPTLKSLFSIVKPRNPSELRMGEFIRFSFDETANKKFRKLIQKIRSNLREESLTKQNFFLPFAFPTLLNFLSAKATRNNLLKQIKKNALKVDLVFEDIKMFEEVLTLSQKSEKTENQETYIYRQIKLEKELEKLRKKINKDLTKEELRRLLPFEAFLSKALIDEESEEDDSSMYMACNPKIKFDKDDIPDENEMDQFLAKRQRINLPLIRINDQSPTQNVSHDNITIKNQSPDKNDFGFTINTLSITQQPPAIQTDRENSARKREQFIKDLPKLQVPLNDSKSTNSNQLTPVSVRNLNLSPQPRTDQAHMLQINQLKTGQTPLLNLKKLPLGLSQAYIKEAQQIDELISHNSFRVMSDKEKVSLTHRTIIPESLLKDSYQTKEKIKFEEDLQRKIEYAQAETLDKVGKIIKDAQVKAEKDRPRIIGQYLKENQRMNNRQSRINFGNSSNQLESVKGSPSINYYKYYKQNESNQNEQNVSNQIERASSGLVQVRDDAIQTNTIRALSSQLLKRSAFSSQTRLRTLSSHSNLFSIPHKNENVNRRQNFSTKNFQIKTSPQTPSVEIAQQYRDLTTAASSANILAGERPVMNQKEMNLALKKFSTNEFQHFSIMLKVNSPKSRQGITPREKQEVIKESITNVVGNAVANSRIKYYEPDLKSQKWHVSQPFISRVKNNLQTISTHANQANIAMKRREKITPFSFNMSQQDKFQTFGVKSTADLKRSNDSQPKKSRVAILQKRLNPSSQLQQSSICSVHQQVYRKICTKDQQFLCQMCENDHKEHIVKSLAFVAEEVSESLRVIMVPNEKMIENFQNIIKDSQDKFKKSNVRNFLQIITNMIRNIVKQFEKSQVLDDCASLAEGYKTKVEKINNLRKKIKQGDKQCIEVLNQKQEIEETIAEINRDQKLAEIAMKELRGVNSEDLNVQIGDQKQQDSLREQLMFSFLELIKEKNIPLASLLIPTGLSMILNTQLQQNQSDQAERLTNLFSPKQQSGLFQFGSGLEGNFNHDQLVSPRQINFIEKENYDQRNTMLQAKIQDKFEVIEQSIQKVHNDFMNMVMDFNQDYYVSCASDFTVKVWSKQSFSQVESFSMKEEVVCMGKAADDQLICGMINGVIGIIDIAALRILRILDKAHSGTVISCLALNKLDLQYVVTQDDAREIKVWKLNDFSVPLIKIIGRSYNPVWYVQTLIQIDLELIKDPVIISACGNEPKVVLYRIDLGRKELEQISSCQLKGIPTALVQLTSQFCAVSSTSEIEFIDVKTSQVVNIIQTQAAKQGENSLPPLYQSQSNVMTMSVLPVIDDPLKKYLAFSGQNKTITIYKIDTIQRCQSNLIFSIQTSHLNTINNLSFVKSFDQYTSYIVTASIDKQKGIYKVLLPRPVLQDHSSLNTSQSSPLKGKSMSRMGSQAQFGAGIKANAENQSEKFKFLNDYLGQKSQGKDKNTASCCAIF
ncbi:ef hand family protein [Stylonychia lemnae]|uniref:Ef hand family protein n=1 Tax=Stylonychia lemnae TaxID=5949 RepID=A0A078ARC2_STYLE|nr:ef hand family protein [Stylonychia lemnae]|eukprot:CDW84990.1 ef hand family protein [Stylonychia lemnae]